MTETRFALSRHLSTGEIDKDFGSDGRVVTRFRTQRPRANRVVRYGRWKVLAAGYAGPLGGGDQFALARYRWNGKLDESFGEDGKVVTFLGPELALEEFYTVADVRVGGEGKILVAAVASDGDDGHVVSVRYNRDGSLDKTHGENGFVVSETTELPIDVAKLLPSGGFVAAGNEFFARFKADGSFDPSFGGGDGYTIVDKGMSQDEYFWPMSIEIDSRQRILVGGKQGESVCWPCYIRVYRFTPTGELNKSFSGDGILVVEEPDKSSHLQDLVVQPNNKILTISNTRKTFRFDRFTTAGNHDAAFGLGGVARADFPPANQDEFVSAAALHPGGRIVFVGSAGRPRGEYRSNFAIARMHR